MGASAFGNRTWSKVGGTWAVVLSLEVFSCQKKITYRSTFIMANSKCWRGNWSHMTTWKSSFACLIWTRRKSDLAAASPHSSYRLVLSRPSQAVLLRKAMSTPPSSLYSSPRSYNLASRHNSSKPAHPTWAVTKLLPWTPSHTPPAWPLQHVTAWWLFPWGLSLLASSAPFSSGFLRTRLPAPSTSRLSATPE